MPNIYRVAEPSEKQRITRLLQEQSDVTIFKNLTAQEITVALLFAYSDRDPKTDEPTGGYVLKHGGYPAAALVRINNLRSRVQGAADATIEVDAAVWESLDEEGKDALLTHELYHLLVQFKDGCVQRDDAGRPKLKLRKHDFQIGGFHYVAKKFGFRALEVQAVVEVEKQWKQLELDFMGGDQPSTPGGSVMDAMRQAVEEIVQEIAEDGDDSQPDPSGHTETISLNGKDFVPMKSFAEKLNKKVGKKSSK